MKSDEFLAYPEAADTLHVLMAQAARALRAIEPLSKRRSSLTLTLGNWQSKEEMVETVENRGHKVSKWAKRVIGNRSFIMSTEAADYEFVEATVAEVVGHNDLATTDELYAAQEALGFLIAPHESALAIRTLYTDQPLNEWRVVLSEPVADAGGNLGVLDVEHDRGGSWVDGYYARPEEKWGPSCRLWLCRKPKLGP